MARDILVRIGIDEGQAVAAGQRFINNLEMQAVAIDKAKQESISLATAMKELKASELGLSDAAAPFINRMKASENGMETARRAVNSRGSSFSDDYAAEQRAAQNLLALKARVAAQSQIDAQALLAESAAAQQAKASNDAYLASLSKRVQMATQTPAQMLEMEAAQRGITAQAAPMIAALKASEGAMHGANVAAKQAAWAMRLVPAQFTDIVTSIAAGQNPMMVMIQQGGQLKDMFGGVGAATKALGGYIMGLISPLSVAAGAAGTLALAYYQGSEESTKLAKAMILSGNAAGTTAGQLSALSASIAEASGATMGKVSDVLEQAVKTGKVSSESLGMVATASVNLERNAGKAVSETIKEFIELGKEPVSASAKLNEQYGYLTASVYEQIRALDDQGRSVEAAKLAQETYADAMNRRTADVAANLGTLESAWRIVSDQAKRAWDAMLGVGRADTFADINKQLQFAVASGATDAEISALEKKLDAIQSKNDAASKKAKSEADVISSNKDGIKAIEAVTRANESALSKTEQMNKALKDYRKNIDDIRASNPNSALLDPSSIKKAEDAIRQRFAEKSSTGRSSGNDDFNQIMSARLSMVRDNARAEVDIIKDKVAAGEIAEREGIDKVLEAKRQGFAKEAALLRQQLAGTKDAGQRERIIADIEKVGNASRMADSEAAKGIAKINESFARSSREAGQYITDLQGKFSRANEGFADSLQILPESVVKLNAELRKVDETAEQAASRLARMFGDGKLSVADYAAKMGELNIIIAEQKDRVTELLGQQQAMNESFQTGADRALNKYADSARKTADSAEQAFSRSFQGMEDALVKFVQTGKLSFTDMINAFIADIVRLQIRQAATAAIGSSSGGGTNWLGIIGGIAGMFGGTSATAATASALPGNSLDNFLALNNNFTKNAMGGVYQSPSLHQYANQIHDTPKLFQFAKGGVFAEAGPEAIMPLSRGADGKLGVRAEGRGMGGMVINQTINAGQGTDKAEIRRSHAAAARAALGAMSGAQRYA